MLVAFTGEIASGKDTAFFRTRSIYSDHKVLQFGFADKMKDSISELFGLRPEFIELEKRNPLTTVTLNSPVYDANGEYLEDSGITLTFRQFLQRYGTEAHRGVFGNDFWVDNVLPMDFDHSGMIACFTDTRFPNELQRIRDLGGMNILIENDTQEGSLSESTHVSETSIDMSLIDHVIDNRIRNDHFESLDKQLQAIFQPVMNKV